MTTNDETQISYTTTSEGAKEARLSLRGLEVTVYDHAELHGRPGFTIAGDLRFEQSQWDITNHDIRDAVEAYFAKPDSFVPTGKIEYDPEISCFFAYATSLPDGVTVAETALRESVLLTSEYIANHPPAHDYATRQVAALDLDSTMVLVGQSGGLSAIYDVRRTAVNGMVSVETEHGFLNLDVDDTYDVLDA